MLIQLMMDEDDDTPEKGDEDEKDKEDGEEIGMYMVGDEFEKDEV